MLCERKFYSERAMFFYCHRNYKKLFFTIFSEMVKNVGFNSRGGIERDLSFRYISILCL